MRGRHFKMDLHNERDDTHEVGLNDETGSETNYEETPAAALERELHVSGVIHLAVGNKDGVEIHRGMKILTTEGEVAGVVAGVIHNRSPHRAEYILLSRPSQQLEYRMVPVELVQQIDRESVLLYIAAPLVNTLRPWHN